MPLDPDDLAVFESIADALRKRFGKAGYDAYALALHRAGYPFEARLYEEDAGVRRTLPDGR